MTNNNIDSKFLIAERFGDETKEQIIEVLERLNIFIPDSTDLFRHGYDGNILLMEDYGIALKIEPLVGTKNVYKGRRVLDPDVLQPFFQVRVRNITIDLFPGTDIVEISDKQRDTIGDKFHGRNINPCDLAKRNIGQLPNGELVSIDTHAQYDELLSTGTQIKGIAATKEVIRQRREKFKGCAQEELYLPLKLAFQSAYESGDKDQMNAAWELCLKFKEDGLLISGWTKLNEKDPEYSDGLIGPVHAAVESMNYATKSREYRQNKAPQNV